MGYRSQVSLAIKQEVYNKHFEKVQEAISSCDLVLKTETAFIFQWDSVKWYESYEDIQIIEALMAEIDEDDYGFVRLGEEIDDSETKGDPSTFELYIERTISNPNESADVTKDFFTPNSIKFIKDTP